MRSKGGNVEVVVTEPGTWNIDMCHSYIRSFIHPTFLLLFPKKKCFYAFFYKPESLQLWGI